MNKKYIINTSPYFGGVYSILDKKGSNFILHHAFNNLTKFMVESIVEYMVEGVPFNALRYIDILLQSGTYDPRILNDIMPLIERAYFMLVSFIVDKNLMHNQIEFVELKRFDIVIEVS